MGFEVRFFFHPRKEEGGYDTSTREEKLIKVGSPFDDTPLEKLAAAIMEQLARRDIWVVDVEPVELIRRPITFKESKDGRGIVLKNKRFSLNSTAQMTCEEVAEAPVQEQSPQPHELITVPQLDDLYGNPNRPVPVKKLQPATPVNQKRVLYYVYFEPEIVYINEVKRLNLKFTKDKKYPVHQVVPHPTGKLDAQKIVVTDDLNRPITVDEKFFTTAGQGLLADQQLQFSGSNGHRDRKPKLMYEEEMVMDGSDPRVAGRQTVAQGIPIDDGSVPEHLMAVPDIRSGRRPMR